MHLEYLRPYSSVRVSPFLGGVTGDRLKVNVATVELCSESVAVLVSNALRRLRVVVLKPFL